MRICIVRVLLLVLLLSPAVVLAGPDRVARALEQQRTQGDHSSAGPLAPGNGLAKQSGRNRAVCVMSVDPVACAAPAADLLAAQRDGTAVLDIITGPAVAAAAPEAIA